MSKSNTSAAAELVGTASNGVATNTNASFAAIAEALRAAQTVAVLSHVRPDGDAFGSQLAMALSLTALGKQVTVWNEDGMLEKYSFMPGADLLAQPPAEPQTFDLGVALDTAIQTRLGTAGEAVRAAKVPARAGCQTHRRPAARD